MAYRWDISKMPKIILPIFTLYKDEIIAVAYIILPDKQQPSYQVVFDKPKELLLGQHKEI
jgi:hypothetical protein